MDLDLKTGLIIVVLLLLVYFLNTRLERFTVADRVAILEKRVDALFSGGAGLRGQSLYSGVNQ